LARVRVRRADDQRVTSRRTPFDKATDTPLVLLVDRDPDTRALYAEYLNQAGWQTQQAEDGRDALAKTYSAHPRVIITDTRLPFIDGYELCRLLRRTDETAALPIIILTGDAFPAQIERARRAGADAVLTKPCLPDALAAEIERLTEQSNGGSSSSARKSGNGNGDSVLGAAAVAHVPSARRTALARAHPRYRTASPPVAPPVLVCPICDAALQYRYSHLGGVSSRHPEQWDEYTCPQACGVFQYRHRTRKLRRVE
jgi:two-component system cell cycle response regulator DivK